MNILNFIKAKTCAFNWSIGTDFKCLTRRTQGAVHFRGIFLVAYSSPGLVILWETRTLGSNFSVITFFCLDSTNVKLCLTTWLSSDLGVSGKSFYSWYFSQVITFHLHSTFISKYIFISQRWGITFVSEVFSMAATVNLLKEIIVLSCSITKPFWKCSKKFVKTVFNFINPC